MPRGAPDYQQINSQTVRLEQGSVNQSVYDTGFARFDGGGRVVWFDDFRSGLYRHNLSNDAGGALPLLDVTETHLFGFSPSAKLGPVVNGGQSIMASYFPTPLSGKMGIEFTVWMSTNHGRLEISFASATINGNNYGFGLRIEEGTNKFYIFINGGVQLVFTPATASAFENRFISVKVTFDPFSGKYSQVLLGGEFIDVSNYSPAINFSIPKGIGYYDFTCFGQSAVLKEPVYVGYVAISADEP